MRDNSFYQIYFDCDLETKKQTYEFISDIACQSSSEQKTVILEQFEEREKVGSPLIEEHVLLPHIESQYVSTSQVLIFKFKNPMDWDENIKDIHLVIAILLKKGEEQAIKKKISMFTRSLADEEFLNHLLNAKNTLDFQNTIIRFQEASL